MYDTRSWSCFNVFIIYQVLPLSLNVKKKDISSPEPWPHLATSILELYVLDSLLVQILNFDFYAHDLFFPRCFSDSSMQIISLDVCRCGLDRRLSKLCSEMTCHIFSIVICIFESGAASNLWQHVRVSYFNYIKWDGHNVKFVIDRSNNGFIKGLVRGLSSKFIGKAWNVSRWHRILT